MSRTIGKLANALRRMIGSEPRWSDTVDDFYPVHPRPRWGYGRAPHPNMLALLRAGLDGYAARLREFRQFKPEFAAIPLASAGATLPAWDNTWFTGLDAAALMALIALRAPSRHVEIGGGISTRFARHIIAARNLPTRLVSIDPEPRSEIDGLCDEVICKPLEDVDLGYFETLRAGDILFFDGSHRVFTNSDTTTLFFDVLPRLKPGVLIHLHDIYWPDDYPPEWSGRLYSEQYLLGAFLLGGGAGLDVILPNHFVTQEAATKPLVATLGIPTAPDGSVSGTSLWLETK